MNNFKSILLLFVFASLNGCSTISSSSTPYVAVSEQTTGAIFITQSALPSEIQYEIVGQVEAKARIGYNSVQSLYPRLAEEARKVGANAIMNTQGGRAIVPFSWAAPYTNGTAVKVKNTAMLKSLQGSFY